MHVSCPSCGTTYRVPAPFRRRRNPTFECTGCGHVFEPAPSEPDWDDDEPFVMDDDDARERGVSDDTPLDDEDVDDDIDEDDIAEDADDGEEADEDEPRRAPARGARRSNAEPPARRTRSRRTPSRPPTSPARFATRCFLGVVLFYCVVGVYVTTFPESARAAMARIPLIGSSLARAPLGPGQMGLTDVSATLQPLAGSKDDPPALVVVATVTNHAAVTAEQIDLRIDLDGPEPRVERRICTGATLNVSSFKRGELELMAGYNRSRVARIAPGGSATCQSLFLSYPNDLRSVRVQVASAHAR